MHSFCSSSWSCRKRSPSKCWAALQLPQSGQQLRRCCWRCSHGRHSVPAGRRSRGFQGFALDCERVLMLTISSSLSNVLLEKVLSEHRCMVCRRVHLLWRSVRSHYDTVRLLCPGDRPVMRAGCVVKRVCWDLYSSHHATLSLIAPCNL